MVTFILINIFPVVIKEKKKRKEKRSKGMKVPIPDQSNVMYIKRFDIRMNNKNFLESGIVHFSYTCI